MESKKSNEASIEFLKIPIFLLGLTAAAIFLFMAFEIKTSLGSEYELPEEKKALEDEKIEEVILVQNVPPPPPPPPP
ncbi:MAG: energy transducer TonB, partial [Flavobacteriales bacterium]|nr:energy transducer TonB [Flavobacteriales bacterium]